MSEEPPRWSAGDRESLASPVTESIERQLALTDRIIALEAQLAQATIGFSLTPSEELRVEHQLARIRATLTWRIGRAALFPLRLVQRLRRGGAGARG